MSGEWRREGAEVRDGRRLSRRTRGGKSSARARSWLIESAVAQLSPRRNVGERGDGMWLCLCALQGPGGRVELL